MIFKVRLYSNENLYYIKKIEAISHWKRPYDFKQLIKIPQIKI